MEKPRDRATRVGLYVRVSTDEQALHGTSIEHQKEGTRDLAERKGSIVRDTYADEGETGANLDRPQFQRLLADCRAGEIDKILVYKLDRLSRNTVDAAPLVLRDLKEMGVTVESVAEPVDTETPKGEMSVAQQFNFADYERKVIALRTTSGTYRRLKEGRYVGGEMPYGCAWDREKKEFHLVPGETEVYRLIFSLAMEDRSDRAIERELASRGCRNRLGRPFCRRQISRLLSSTAAYGEWMRNRRTTKMVRDPVSQRRFDKETYARLRVRPKEEWIPVPVPAIVSREVWDEVQAVRAKHRKNASRNDRRHEYLIRGLFFCGGCGGRMIGVGRVHYRYSVCASQIYRFRRSTAGEAERPCRMWKTPTEEIDLVVWGELRRVIEDPKVLARSLAVLGPPAEGKAKRKDEAELRKGLASIAQEEDRLLRQYRKGTLPERLFEEHLAEVGCERKRLTGEIERRSQGERLEAEAEREFGKLEGFLARLRGKLDGLSFSEKRELVTLIVPGGKTYRITIDLQGMVEITGRIDAGSLTRAASNPPVDVTESNTLRDARYES